MSLLGKAVCIPYPYIWVLLFLLQLSRFPARNCGFGAGSPMRCSAGCRAVRACSGFLACFVQMGRPSAYIVVRTSPGRAWEILKEESCESPGVHILWTFSEIQKCFPRKNRDFFEKCPPVESKKYFCDSPIFSEIFGYIQMEERREYYGYQHS